MKKATVIILAIIAVVGLVAVILAIIGVATKTWISVSGNTDELKKKFLPLTDPNGVFVNSVSAALSLPLPVAQTRAIIVAIANQTLIQVEMQLSANLQLTTYSLFDKQVSKKPATDVDELKLPQGLIVAGLVCLFVGTISAAIMTFLNLGKFGFVRVIPLIVLAIGSILILLGYLLFTKIIVEDFGHDLGIESQLGASFVLAVLSSIIGFATAVIFGSTMLLRRDRSGSVATDRTTETVGHVALKARHSGVAQLPKNVTTSDYENGDGF
jgi:hypothetical protein